jgi:uncharacterized protein involved in exopolysaccharide biosynthesis
VARVLQNYSALQQGSYEDGRRGPGLSQYLQIAKRRLFYFLIPFVLISSAGLFLAAVQQPIYLAEGKILVESQEIPTDLVRSTVADSANQRIQVIQQRIMTRDKLLGIVNKFDLFAAQRQWMSGTQLLDLMKERTQLRQVELNLPTASVNNHAIAFTLSFEHENPELAMRVANEFLTLILAEDARTRTNQATETTKFLEGEVKRLDNELSATEMKISELRRRPREPGQELPDQVKSGAKLLADLKAELVQKASIYSEAHPAVQALRSRVAALEKIVANEAPTAPTPPTVSIDSEIEALERQVTSIDRSLDEANRKLTLARLGERMERDQQAERLRVIEQPTAPQKPVRPNRVKLLTMAFALAGMAGLGAVFTAEALDRTIRGSHELAGVIDSHLVVTIPYIATKAETLKSRGRVVLLVVVLVAIALVGVAGAIYFGPPVDVSTLVNRAWVDILTRLTK